MLSTMNEQMKNYKAGGINPKFYESPLVHVVGIECYRGEKLLDQLNQKDVNLYTKAKKDLKTEEKVLDTANFFEGF